MVLRIMMLPVYHSLCVVSRSPAEPSKIPFPITDPPPQVSYHCAIQPSTINPDLSADSSLHLTKTNIWVSPGSTHLASWPFGYLFQLLFRFYDSSWHILSFWDSPLFGFCLFLPLFAYNPHGLWFFPTSVAGYGVWVLRFSFALRLEWQAWLATGVSFAIEFYCFPVLFPPSFFFSEGQ